MKILLVNKYWWPVGGVEEHLFQLRDLFEERGHTVIPFGMEGPVENDVVADGAFVSPVEFRGTSRTATLRATARAVSGWESLKKLRRLLRHEAVDVAYVLHAYHQLGMTILPALKAAGVPTILSLHDYKVGCPSYRFYDDASGSICTKCTDRTAGWLYAPVTTACWNGSRTAGGSLVLEAISANITRAYRAPDRVVLLNELQRAAAINRGVDADKIVFLPHWVEPAEVGGHRPEERSERILYVGRLVREKGVDVAIRSAAMAKVPLKVVGDGRERAALEALSTNLGVDVQFTGQLPRTQVIDEVRRAAALVVPSVWHEVFPLVVCEAMGVGTPIIGTSVGGVADLLSEGRGILVPPDDVTELSGAFRSIMEDQVGAAAVGAEAQRWAHSELSRTRWEQGLTELFEGLGLAL